jgi:hypothetical protein
VYITNKGKERKKKNHAKEMPLRFLFSPLDEVMFRKKPSYAAF